MQKTSLFIHILTLTSISCVVCVQDLYLIGLAPFEGSWTGGYSIVAAMNLALKHISEKENFLDGYNMKILWNNTSCDGGTGLDMLYYQLYKKPTKIMVLGAACSVVSEATALVSYRWNLVQISHVSSSPVLSNKDKYKWFFRTTPPETHSIVVLIEIFKYFKWTKISTIHQPVLLFAETNRKVLSLLDEENMENLASTIVSGDDVSSPVAQLKELNSRIIVGYFYEDVARKVLCEAYKINLYGPNIVWILCNWYSTNWWSLTDPSIPCTPDQLLKVINGYISVDEYWLPNISRHTVAGYRTEEIVQFMLNMEEFQSFGISIGLMSYDSVWTAAIAINKTIADLKNHGGNLKIEDFTYTNTFIGRKLFEYVRRTDFDGASGHVVFDKSGDRQNMFKIEVFKDGRHIVIGTYDQTDPNARLSWVSDNVQSIIWKDGRVPLDSPVFVVKYKKLSLPIYIVFCILSSLGIALTIFFFAFFYINRKSRIIKISSPRLSYFTLVGCILMYISVFIHEIHENPNITICQMRIVSIVVGVSLTYGSLFAKQWRVYKIFTTGAKQRVNIQDVHLLLLVTFYVMINVAVVTIWFIMDPFTIKVYKDELAGSDKKSFKDAKQKKYEEIAKVLVCESQHGNYYVYCVIAIQAVLMILGTFLAVQTRNIKIKSINNSKSIGISIYNFVILMFLEVVVSYALGTRAVIRYIVTSIITLVGTTLTQCFIMVPKVREFMTSEDVMSVQ